MADLKPKQRMCIEEIISHPEYSNVKLAEVVGVNRNTISAWKHNDEFQNALKQRLKETWADAEAIAVKTMRNLAAEGNFNAAKYILDSNSYVTQHIEADVKTDIIIDIVGE